MRQSVTYQNYSNISIVAFYFPLFIEIEMIFLRLVASGLLLCASTFMFASQDGKMHAIKSTLAIGATFDDKGRLWLVKVENQRLFIYQSKNEGKDFSKPVLITPEPENILADGENRAKIAVMSDGVVIVTWTQSLPQKFSGNIRFSRSTDSGETFSKPLTLNDDGRITSHRFDALTTDGAGRVVVAWLDARDRDVAKERGEEFLGPSIYTAQSTDNGVSFSVNQKFQEHVCECCRVSLGWTTDGPIAFWRNIFDTNTRDFAIAALDTGALRRATDDSWKIDACPHHGGDMAIDAQDRLHLVWFTNGEIRQGLFYKQIKGERESMPLAIGNSAAQASHPSIAVEGNMVLLAWREFNGETYSVQIMYSDNAGISWSKSQQVANSTGGADYPLPLINGQKMLVVWNTSVDGLQILPVSRN